MHRSAKHGPETEDGRLQCSSHYTESSLWSYSKGNIYSHFISNKLKAKTMPTQEENTIYCEL